MGMGRGLSISANGPPRARRLAGAPISWGVCEVPGWGHMLPPERVLAEMASLGLSATELGPVGYLPLEPAKARELLARHGLRVVAGFVPLVLHERSLGDADVARRVAALLRALGAEVLVAAAVTDAAWSPRVTLDDSAWRRLSAHLAEIAELASGYGLTLAVHPHAGTLLETEEEIERILAASDVPFCLDTGHCAIGGADPAELVRRHGERIVHVHLKDVDLGLAEQVRSGALSLVEGTRRGLFRPLGSGDAEIAEVVGLLDRGGYGRWLVLEQDMTLTGEEPPVGHGPVVDVQRSIDYLANLAPANTGGGVHKT
jgi:inosose dehydratase